MRAFLTQMQLILDAEQLMKKTLLGYPLVKHAIADYRKSGRAGSL